MAGWGDEKLEFVKEKLTSEATQQDITKGKSPEQVSRGVWQLTSGCLFNTQIACSVDFVGDLNSWEIVRDEDVSMK